MNDSQRIEEALAQAFRYGMILRGELETDPEVAARIERPVGVSVDARLEAAGVDLARRIAAHRRNYEEALAVVELAAEHLRAQPARASSALRVLADYAQEVRRVLAYPSTAPAREVANPTLLPPQVPPVRAEDPLPWIARPGEPLPKAPPAAPETT